MEQAPVNLHVFGLAGSGTSWASSNIELNWPGHVRVWQTKGRHKQATPDEVEGMDGYVICLKHPYSWIDSQLRNPNAKTHNLYELVQWWNLWHLRMMHMTRRPDVVLLEFQSLLLQYSYRMRLVETAFLLPPLHEYQRIRNIMLDYSDDTPMEDRVSDDAVSMDGLVEHARGYSLDPDAKREIKNRIDWQLWDRIKGKL